MKTNSSKKQSKTDWSRVDAMSDDDIDCSDIPELSAEWFEKAKLRMPMKNVKVIPDFLPSPEELVLKDETVKITISLSKVSVDFFKKEAEKYHTQYQKMIRRLLDEYAARQA